MKRIVLTVMLGACGGQVKPLPDDGGSTVDGGFDGGSTVDGGSDGGADGGSDGGGDGGGSTTGDGGGSTTGDGGGSTTGDGGGSTTGDGGGSTTGDGGGVAVAVDYCHIQWPCSISGAPGASADVYVWIYQEGVTAGVGAGSGLLVSVGHGADGLDPTDASWTWFSAAWYDDKDGLVDGDLANDEYLGTMTLPGTSGTYDYAGRVSADDGLSWLYCDLAESEENRCGGSGSEDGYSPTTAGSLTVR